MGKRHSPSFPWKEVPRRGGGWNRRGMKGNMRKAFSRIVIPSGAEGSLPFAVRDSRVPHMCRALLRFPHLFFIPLEPYPARFARHLPHGGRLTIRDMLFFHLFSCPPGCFCFLLSHSPVFPCARKISPYARNDDMGGRRPCEGSAFLHDFCVAP